METNNGDVSVPGRCLETNNGDVSARKNFYDPVLEGNSENIIPVLNRYSGKLMVLMKIFEVALMNIPCPGIKKQMYIPVPEFLTKNETLLAGRS